MARRLDLGGQDAAACRDVVKLEGARRGEQGPQAAPPVDGGQVGSVAADGSMKAESSATARSWLGRISISRGYSFLTTSGTGLGAKVFSRKAKGRSSLKWEK